MKNISPKKKQAAKIDEIIVYSKRLKEKSRSQELEQLTIR